MAVTLASVKSLLALIMGSFLIVCVITIGVSMSHASLHGNCTLEMSLNKEIKVHQCPASVLAIREWSKEGHPKRAGVNLDRNQTEALKQCLNELDVLAPRKHDLECEDSCIISESMYLRRCPLNIYQIRRLIGGRKASLYGINLDREAILLLSKFLNKK